MGSTVSIYDVVLELPSEKSFLPLGVDMCAELVVNGEADGDGFHYHQMYSTDTSYFNPLIIEEMT